MIRDKKRNIISSEDPYLKKLNNHSGNTFKFRFGSMYGTKKILDVFSPKNSAHLRGKSKEEVKEWSKSVVQNKLCDMEKIFHRGDQADIGQDATEKLRALLTINKSKNSQPDALKRGWQVR